MRLVYIISAYKLPHLLVRLVRRLQTPNTTFFIHVDKKSGPQIFRPMQAELKGSPGVHFVKRHVCHWGDFGHVEATLKGIREIYRRSVSCDYTVLLTGQDYPIKANGEVESRLSRHAGRSFMEYEPLEEDSPRWATDRFRYWHYRIGGKEIRFPKDSTGGKFFPVWKTVNALLPARRPFLRGFKPYLGSGYWCLSGEATRFVYDYVDQNPDFIDFFRSVHIPDEMFFQTLLLNSPLRDKVINDNLRYIDWSASRPGRAPHVLGVTDFERLRASEKLFARKFDPEVDSQILDLIDEHLLSRAPGHNFSQEKSAMN